MPETKSILIIHALENKKLGSEFFSLLNSGLGVIPCKMYSFSTGGSGIWHGEFFLKRDYQ